MYSYYKFNFNDFFNDLTKTRKDLLDSFSKSGPSFTYYSKTTVPIESKDKKNNHIDSLNEKEFDKLLEAVGESIYKEKGKEMSDKYREDNSCPKNETKTYYLVTDKPNGVTVYDPNWVEAIDKSVYSKLMESLTAEKPYLWTYSSPKNEGFFSMTEPRIIFYYNSISEGDKELPGVSGEFHNIDFNSLGGRLELPKNMGTIGSKTPKGSLEVVDKQIEHVNHPSHYNDNEIETFEMFLLFYHNQPEKIQGALIFNIFKYRDRLGKKESPGDAEKMKWYLDKFELLFPDEYELYNIYHSSKGNS